MKNKDFLCLRCNAVRKGIDIKLIDLGEGKDPIYKATCEVCGFELFAKPEYDPPNYYQYITAVIIIGTSWIKFRFVKLGFMLCRERLNRVVQSMKDVDQAINDFAKLDWELISIKNIKTFPGYNYAKKEYRLIKVDSIFYLFFKRKYCGQKLLPKIGHDYTTTRSEEIEDMPPPEDYKNFEM